MAGAWIGGNIDTTAAVAAAGAIAGEDALQIATIVKTTQNALIGVVAIALTAYFALKVERRSAEEAPAHDRAVLGTIPEVRARLHRRVDHRHAVPAMGKPTERPSSRR